MKKLEEGVAICKAGGGRRVVTLTLYSNGVVRCGSWKGCPVREDPNCEISRFQEKVKADLEQKQEEKMRVNRARLLLAMLETQQTRSEIK